MSTQREDWARHFMWERLGKEEKKLAVAGGFCCKYQPNEEDFEKADQKMGYQQGPSMTAAEVMNRYIELQVNPPVFVSPLTDWTLKEKQECEMNTLTKEQEARDHLIGRLASISYEKKNELTDHYHIYGCTPRTREQAEQWLKEGNYYFQNGYEYDEDDEGELAGKHSYEGWSWGKKSDSKDYKKALDLLKKEKTAVEDIIRVKDAEAGLAALQAFEAKTFH